MIGAQRLLIGATVAATVVGAGAVSASAAPSVALDIAASERPSPVSPGDSATFTVKVSNDGRSTENRVKFIFSVLRHGKAAAYSADTSACSAGTGQGQCAVGTLATGKSRSFRITTRIPTSDAGGGTVSISARATGAANGTGSFTATVFSSANIRSSQAPAPAPVPVSGTPRFTG